MARTGARALAIGVLSALVLVASPQESAAGPSSEGPTVGVAAAEPPCESDPSSFEACASSGTASLVHSLLGLDPSEQGASELVCNYTGTAQLRMEGGMWDVVYTGQNWHVEGAVFSCGGEVGSDVIVAGTYTLDPLQFSLDEAFVCEGDQFGFDGTTLSGTVNAYCNPVPRDVYTFSVTLGPGGDAAPTDDTGTVTDSVATTSCIPSVSGLSPTQPGEVISPSASYTTSTGEATGVIQDRWFFNGVNTTSIVWDGGPVTVELQYTCLDRSAGYRTYTIPAVGSPTAPTTSPEGQDGGGLGAGGVGVIIAGIVIGGGAAVAGIRKWSGRPTPQPTGAAPAAPQPPPRPPTPPAPPTRPPTRPPPTPPMPPTPPRPTGPTPAERARLEARRAEMQDEIDAQRAAYQRTRQGRAVLVRIMKRNLLKFILKQGLEAQKFIRLDPTSVLEAVGEKLTPESLRVVDRLFQKHDMSKDSDIIVEAKRQVDAMQAEMQQHIENVRHLQQEIHAIDSTLAGGGE